MQFPCSKYDSVRIVRSKRGVEKREPVLKGGKALAEAVSGRATYKTAAAILYAGLAAGVLGEKRCPYRQVGIDDAIRYCTHDCVVTVIEG